MNKIPCTERAGRVWIECLNWARSIVVCSMLAAMAGLAAGCRAVEHHVDKPPMPVPPAVPQNAEGMAMVDVTQPTGGKNEFHKTATDRQRFQLHLDFGRIFEGQGNFDAAVLEYQDALGVVTDRRRGQFTSADEALAQRRMGAALDRLGRFAQAEVHYKKAMKLTPKEPKVWNDVGYSYYLQGRWTDAERAFKTALKLAPEDGRARTNLGLTLAASGRTEQALPLLSRAEGDATGHANLGYLLAATGQYDLARQQYETALAMRPDLQLARRALAKLDLTTQNRPAATPSQVAQAPNARTRTNAGPVDPRVAPASTYVASPSNLPPLPQVPSRSIP
jgi:Flp pilus assembly protein TadD